MAGRAKGRGSHVRIATGGECGSLGRSPGIHQTPLQTRLLIAYRQDEWMANGSARGVGELGSEGSLRN
jgi:hypothetical protein